MAMYRKKPIEIEARQITLETIQDVVDWSNHSAEMSRRVDGTPSGIMIWTLEGRMTANIGDYLVKGVKGEFYACEKSIFEMTYEKVS